MIGKICMILKDFAFIEGSMWFEWFETFVCFECGLKDIGVWKDWCDLKDLCDLKRFYVIWKI